MYGGGGAEKIYFSVASISGGVLITIGDFFFRFICLNRSAPSARPLVEPNPNQIKVFANGHPLQPATSGAASSGRVIVAADVSRLISIRAD